MGSIMQKQCIEELLKKGWVRDALSKTKSKGGITLRYLDLSFVNELYEQSKETKKGCPPTYLPDAKLKGILFCLASGTKRIRGMARLLKETIAKIISGFDKSSPSTSTISRFFRFLSGIIDVVFQHLAVYAAHLGIYGSRFLIDTTSLEVSSDDPDGKWNYDATKKKWYYGYGLELIADWKTHLPIAVVFNNGKHVGTKEIQKGIQRMMVVKKPTMFIGDGEFDIKNIYDMLIVNGILPIMHYNPRNNKSTYPYRFRVEELVQQRTQGNVSLHTTLLVMDYKKRIEIEHAISMIKDLGLEYPQVKGFQAVKTHAYLILIYRLAIGISKFIENPDSNLRKINIEL